MLEDLHKSSAAGKGAKQGVQPHSSTHRVMEAGVSGPISAEQHQQNMQKR